MTREEAMEEAALCAKAALGKLQGRTGPEVAEAYAKTGMLFIEIAKLTGAPPPPPPPRPPLVAVN